jgi:hypothetical protein
MSSSIAQADVFAEIDTRWPPLANVERGWQRLDGEGRARVRQRVEGTLDRYDPPEEVNEAALRRFFSFLAQMEPIAIDVPLLGLPEADAETRPLLERQLADEVFHALLFARLAERMGGLAEPITQGERLLATIRAPDDPRTRAVLLNVIAEGWFETLFEHAAGWGVADEIFEIALADEERHVEEGHVHAEGITPAQIEPAVREFEQELFGLVQHPRLMLPTLTLAGEANFRQLSEAYLATHEQALAEVGLEPPEELQQIQHTLDDIQTPEDPLAAVGDPERVEPESRWRETAHHLWDTPRDPVMHGWLDVETDHIPPSLLTPVMVAAVGRVWHEYPRMNRYTIGGEVYEPASVNVGVRVALGEQQEALSTIVVPDAHDRSIEDIQRILETGVREMNELGEELADLEPDEAEPLRDVLRDEELMGMVPPEMVAAPVTVSNVGPSGLVAGFGAMPGALGQSVELIVGREEQRPVWNGERYVPGDAVTVGASADHRVIDGHHAGQAMDRIQAALSEDGVDRIVARPDTIPPDADLSELALAPVGMNREQAQIMMSCKLPFWLGWLCWFFKK